MSELEELLQRKLEALEDGASPGKTAKGLAGEAADLEPLIYLVAALRDMPHPELAPDFSRSMQKELVSTAQRSIKPKIAARRSFKPQLSSGSLAWLFTPGFASLTLVFLGFLVVFLGARVWLSGPRLAHTAVLRNLTGQVQVADSSQASWKNASEGLQVRSGQLIRTLPDSSATLVFFDGSQTVLGPATGLVLSEVAGGWGNVLHVKLSQQYGLTSHHVVPFREKQSSFSVNTSAGSASVRGTAFSVASESNGKAYFAVETGQVLVENEKGDVTLDPGQATAVLFDQAPQPPAYTFTLTDTLILADGDTWWIGGVPFVITDDTLLLGELQPGASVAVTGRILGDGRWMVDSVQPAKASSRNFTFAGVVQEMGAETWLINGISVQVNLATRLLDNIQVGYVVEVKYVILGSGSWQALEIATLVAGKIPKPKATLTGSPSPSQELSSAELGSQVLSQAVDCTGAEPHPEAATLADRYAVPVGAIMGWFCQGFGFGEIDQAYSLRSSDMPVEAIFALRQSGQSWGEINQNLSSNPANKSQPANENKPVKTPKPANENQPVNEDRPTKTPRP